MFVARILDDILPGTPEWRYCEQHKEADVASARTYSTQRSENDRTPYYIVYSTNQNKFCLIVNQNYIRNDIDNVALFYATMKKALEIVYRALILSEIKPGTMEWEYCDWRKHDTVDSVKPMITMHRQGNFVAPYLIVYSKTHKKFILYRNENDLEGSVKRFYMDMKDAMPKEDATHISRAAMEFGRFLYEKQHNALGVRHQRSKKRSMKKRSMKKRSMKKRSMKKRSMKKRSMKKRYMRKSKKWNC